MMNGPFNIGDRVVIINRTYSGVVVNSNYDIDKTYQVLWDKTGGFPKFTTWVYSNDISLDKQIIREEKLNKLGI